MTHTKVLRLLTGSLPFVAILLLSGCGGDPTVPEVPEASRITVTLSSDALSYGETASATVAVYDQNDEPMSGQTVTWASTDQDVATVSGGTVTATGVGDARIMATIGSLSDEAALTVTEAEHALEAPAATTGAYEVLLLGLPAGLEAPAEDVSTEIAGDTLWFTASGDTAIAALLPDVGDGTHEVAIHFGPNHIARATFTTAAAPHIDDPAGSIDAVSIEVQDALDAMEAELAGADPSLGSDYLGAARILLDEFSAGLAGLDAEDQQELAAFLATHPDLFSPMTSSGSAVFSMTDSGPDAAVISPEVKEGLVTFGIIMAGVHATISTASYTLRTCQKSKVLRTTCGLAVAVIGGALAAQAILANVSAEEVLDGSFKPYEDMLAELNGALPSGEMEASAPSEVGSAGPFDFYQEQTLELGVTQPYATLESVDQEIATGDTGLFLYAFADFQSLWTDTRLLLEQVARDLGHEVSLADVVAAFRDPPTVTTLDVPAADLTLAAPDNEAVTCSISGETTLGITCATEAVEPQPFTVAAAYGSDFGTQTLEISGLLHLSSRALEMISGNEQTAYPGDPLVDPVQVRVTDIAEGTAVEGAIVQWSIATGDGTVSADSGTTDASGNASVEWTLGGGAERVEGEQTLEVRAFVDGEETGGSPVLFTATADRGRALMLVSGNNQSSAPNSPLDDPLVVRVADSNAQAVEGESVQWSITSGDGSLSALSTLTDVDGETSVTWTMGTDKTGTAEAVVFGASGEHAPGSPVSFSAGTGVELAPGTIAVGSGYSCALATDGSAWCWGNNDAGQLGSGGTMSSSAPVQVSGGHTFVQIDAGTGHTCAVAEDGSAWCWGWNGGVLGTGSETGPESCPEVGACSTVPVQVTGGHAFEQITAGYNHTCAVTTSGGAWCWGWNSMGGLGNGGTTDSAEPRSVSGGHVFEQITAGEEFTCAIDASGGAWCWGTNYAGSLGNGSDSGPELCLSEFPCSTVPVSVAGGHAFEQVTAGEAFACGLRADGSSWCWGSNEAGQLGIGTDMGPEACSGGDQCSTSPVQVLGGNIFTRLGAGDEHICAVAADGEASCWGHSAYDGRLGIGINSGPEMCDERGSNYAYPCSTTPATVTGGHDFRQIMGGKSHSCAVDAAGSVWCWGLNNDGALGTGSSTGPESCLDDVGDALDCSPDPVRVTGTTTFAQAVNAIHRDFDPPAFALSFGRRLAPSSAEQGHVEWPSDDGERSSSSSPP